MLPQSLLRARRSFVYLSFDLVHRKKFILSLFILSFSQKSSNQISNMNKQCKFFHGLRMSRAEQYRSCCITNLVTFVIENLVVEYPLKSLETEFAPSNLSISLFNNNYTVNKKPSISLTRPMEMNMIIKVLPKYVIADMSPNPTVLIVTCQLKTAPVRITIIITMRPIN